MKEELRNQLTTLLSTQERDQESVAKIDEAYEMAYEKHALQKRKSNEPYIIHPTAVAETLIKLNCDTSTICAGLLHDVLEDTNTSREEISGQFGEDVLELVDGVTKLGKLNFKSSEEAQASNFRKMLLAIATDMRVVLVKLADRLHNMRTLEHLRPEKQKAIAQETLDIFAPLANRFGLGVIKTELEDLAFKYLQSDDYIKVKSLVSGKKEEREQRIKNVIEKVQGILDEHGINAEIQGRAKHYFSIHRKIKKQGNEEIYDLLGIRIMVSNVKECYEVLGLIHDAFKPLPGRFKDYIAIPKSNMYQSLHTTVLGITGRPIEIQIRTHEMHSIAENGIAAHWNYKEKGASKKATDSEIEQLSWLRQLISWHTDLADAKEYLDTVKTDLFSQEAYILSPKGDIYNLPMQSSPVDFAYKVHSKVGDTCTGAIVNDKIVALDYKLKNGDVVEIITNKNSHPNLDWLHFVKTNHAKNRIKAWFKKQNRDLHITLGRESLEEEFTKAGYDKLNKSKELEEVAQKLNHKTVEDLLASIGCGDNSVAQIKGKLKDSKAIEVSDPTQSKARRAPKKGDDADIPDLDGLLYHIAKCCLPIPGEEVIGTVTKGKGISIHRADCKNVKQVEPERLMNINWDPKASKAYAANLTIEVIDRVGVVRDLLTLLADEEVNVRDFKVKERPNKTTAVLKVTSEVTGREQLHKLITAINGMSDVVRVERD